MFGISVSVWDFYEFRDNYVRDCYVRENYVAPFPYTPGECFQTCKPEVEEVHECGDSYMQANGVVWT